MKNNDRKKEGPRGRAQRLKITNCAGRLFCKNGYLSTSIDDIAAAAKVNKASIYYYFEDKSSLLFDIMAQAAYWLIESANKDIKNKTTATQKLEALVSNQVRNQLENVVFLQIPVRERRNLPDNLLRAYSKIRDNYEIIFRNVIQEGIDSGEFQVADTRTASLFIVGLLNSFPVWYRKDGAKTPEKISSEACEFVLRGILNHKK